MTSKLEKLFDESKHITLSDSDADIRRQSFAYGNGHLENRRITRETIAKAAKNLKK